MSELDGDAHMSDAGAPPPAPTSTLLIPPDLPFSLPKDVEKGETLMSTSQIEKLLLDVRSRKNQEGVAKNCFILAGPSGIGKSCIALYLALALRQEKDGTKDAVLYVGDTAAFVDSVPTNDPQQAANRYLRKLRDMFYKQNDHLSKPEEVCEDFDEFAAELNTHSAVVIFDEQGSAYTKLMKRFEGLQSFPMLLPNFWTTSGRSVRIVFTGSNQFAFETGLNGTYVDCVRPMEPPTHTEALAMNQLKSWDLLGEDLAFYCNNVPREMRKLFECGSCESYLAHRRNNMTKNLFSQYKINYQGPHSERHVALMLQYLFRDRSIAQGGLAIVPAMDLGYVYRVKRPEKEEAFPLCLPAEAALVELWKTVSTTPPISLSECIRLSKGDDFELLVFDTLVKRHFHENQQLPCQKLGFRPPLVPLPFTLQAVYSATCSSKDDDVIADINRVKRVAENRNLTILYRCPKNTKTIDFCILSPNMVIAIQVSLQSLVSHEKPDADFLKKIGVAERPTGTLTRAAAAHGWLYVHITTNPEWHIVVGSKQFWNGIEVNQIRIVDAEKWIGTS